MLSLESRRRRRRVEYGGKVIAFGAGLLVISFVLGAILALSKPPHAVHMAHMHAGALAIICLAYGAVIDRTRMVGRLKAAGTWLVMIGALLVPGAFLLMMAAEPLAHLMPLGTLLMAASVAILAWGALTSKEAEQEQGRR